ncbi:MAG: hypothetical protein DMG24_08935 [Acidobacteria bacterium]|nr:MAG: hypothetical protein DMG24_08935 [Acidobacteriota bacterium]
MLVREGSGRFLIDSLPSIISHGLLLPSIIVFGLSSKHELSSFLLISKKAIRLAHPAKLYSSNLKET